MGAYEYDEGGIFNYFLISVLTLALAPATYSVVAGSISTKDEHLKDLPSCECGACKAKSRRISEERKRKNGVSIKTILLVLGWVIFTFVAYKAATTTIEESGLWDPYEILGVSTSSTPSEVKKAFRKLSLKFHPDKVQGDEADKEAASKVYNDLSKAQKVLTDEEARKVWDEFGHPDGKQAMTLGIALPKYLVESKNNFLVLFLYGSIFGILMPIFVAKWWYNSKNMNNDKIRHETMGKLYVEVKDQMNPAALVNAICKADELLEAVTYSKSEKNALEQLAQKVAAEVGKYGIIFEANKKYANLGEAMNHKIQILLFSHFCRFQIEDHKLAAEQALVAERASLVVVGVLQICSARFYLAPALAAIDLRQAIVQAVIPTKGPLGQLPYVDLEKLKKFVSFKKQVVCPRQLIELTESEQKELLADIPKDQADEMVAVAKLYPLVRVQKCNFAVIGEEFITPSSIVTLTVVLEHISPKEANREKREGVIPVDVTPPTVAESEAKPPQWYEKKEPPSLFPTHCPYFPREKNSAWWVLMCNPENNRLISLGKITTSGVPGSEPQTCKLQFQAPPNAGSWKFSVVIKNDNNMGCDLTVEMTLDVIDAPELSAAIIEDDISEPGEDTIAGQMAAIKAGKIPGEGGARRAERDEAEDSSDSDDDD